MFKYPQADLIRGTCQQELAIFVRHLGHQAQFYTMTGRWLCRSKSSPKFFVAGFVEPHELEDIIPYLPQTAVPQDEENKLRGFIEALPRNIGRVLLQKMTAFWNEANTTYRTAAQRLDKAHDLLAHPDRYSYATLEQISNKLLRGLIPRGKDEKYPMPVLYAVHRALLRDEIGFRTQKLQVMRSGFLYEINSKSELNIVASVTAMVRKFREGLATNDFRDAVSLSAFIRKARRNIDYSRSFREFTPHGTIGPSAIKSSDKKHHFRVGKEGEAWSGSDQAIIRFMESWACLHSFNISSTLNGIGSEILRATRRYEDVELDRTAAYTFLKEIGAIPPWEDRAAYELRLPYTGRRLSAEPGQTSVMGYVPDRLKDLRKDWGDMTVYCVDDAGAFEIDDGISVQATDNPDEYWIYVHVADPAAQMDPSGVAAKYAEYLTENIYFPERMLPMLDQGVVNARFSLAPNRPCLTFGAKLNMSGEIIESNITPGIIRNVVYCTPDVLSLITTGTPAQGSIVHIVGEETPQTTIQQKRPLLNTHEFSGDQRSELEILHKLTIARTTHLSNRGGVSTSAPRSNVSVSFEGAQWTRPLLNHSHWHYGDPTIRITLQEMSDKAMTEAPNIVTTCMLLAGEIAGGWCSARGIPIPYRITPRNPEKDPKEYFVKHVLPHKDENGKYPMDVLRGYFNVIGKVQPSTTPGPHLGIGAEFMTRCTSPLRRYSDLITHWQIEAALLHEAESGQSLIGNTDESFLPIAKAKLESMLPRLSTREKLVKEYAGMAERMWALEFLVRAWKFGQAKLPSPMNFVVRSVDTFRKSASGVLPDLLVGGHMELPDWIDPEKLKIDDKFEVEIIRVDVPFRKVDFRAVRVVKTEALKAVELKTETMISSGDTGAKLSNAGL
jgi:hypothetical protein